MESIDLACDSDSDSQYILKAEFSPDNACYDKITYTSSDSSIAGVDENGVIKALKPGLARITIKASMNGVNNTPNCSVTIIEIVVFLL